VSGQLNLLAPPSNDPIAVPISRWVLTFVSGSRFRSHEGTAYHVPSWWTLDFHLGRKAAA